MNKTNSTKLTAAIVDDDNLSANLLKKIIEDYIPELSISGVFTQPAEAVREFNNKLPDLIFLDVEMPEINGIELVKLLPDGAEKSIIYVTGHDKFAIEAVKLGVQDYLMKPITAALVKESVEHFIFKKQLKNRKLIATLGNKILINKHDKLFILNIGDIMYMEADGPYTLVYLLNGSQIKSSKSLGYYKKILVEHEEFIAIHRSYFINFNHILGIEKDENNEGALILSNQQKITFSASIKNKLIQLIEDIIMANVKE